MSCRCIDISVAISEVTVGRRRCTWYRRGVRQSRVSRGRRDKPRRKASWASIRGAGGKSEEERETGWGWWITEGCRESKGQRSGYRGVSLLNRLNFAKFETVRGRWRLHPPGVALSLIAARLAPSPRLSLSLSLSSFLPRLSLFLPTRRPRRCTRCTLASAAVAVLWKFWTNSKINSQRRGGRAPRRPASRRERRAFQASLFQRLRKCDVFHLLSVST